MNTTTKRTAAVAAALAGLALTASITGSATADTVGGDNAYTWGEFMDSTFAGQARGNVEGQWGCGCSGHVVDKFRGDDFHLRKVVRYADGDASSVYITYRVDNYGTYRVERRMFATDGEGFTVPFTG